jgi:hypothetical protein
MLKAEHLHPVILIDKAHNKPLFSHFIFLLKGAFCSFFYCGEIPHAVVKRDSSWVSVVAIPDVSCHWLEY